MAKIVLAGASGLIGSAVHAALVARGDEVVQLVRRPTLRVGEAEWDPAFGRLDPEVLAGADAIIALGGASVGRLPWTRAYRRELLTSRLAATRTIANAIKVLRDDAPAFLSGSAVGVYGSRPGLRVTEETSAGSTFLARLCEHWEREARAVEDLTRVTLLRTAPVIHRRGVLKPLIWLTAAGLAGPLGSGDQTWPWISLPDEVRGILHALDNELDGPVNLTGPTRATSNDIGRELARQMGRPFWLRAPEWALKLALSPEATESLLTADADVIPLRLGATGFTFSHPTPADAVRDALSTV